MINLFILVLVQQFEEFHLNENNPLNHWKNNLNSFRKTWHYYSQSDKSMIFNEKKSLLFFKTLKFPMG